MHGGNSPQERIIPVLTITRKQAEAAGLSQYAIEAQPLDDVLGLSPPETAHHLPAPAPDQPGLRRAAQRIDLDLRVASSAPDVRGDRQGRLGAGATMKAGRIAGAGRRGLDRGVLQPGRAGRRRVPGRGPARRQHPEGPSRSASNSCSTSRGARDVVGVARKERGVGATAVGRGLPGPAVSVRCSCTSRSTAAITETEVTLDAGHAAGLPPLLAELRRLPAKAPFGVRIESSASGKRYVREEDKSMALSHRDVEHIFERLRSGLVPERGLDAFAVGIERQRARDPPPARPREGAARASSSSCAAATAAARPSWPAWRCSTRRPQDFATSFVVVSDNDLHFHKFDDVYRKVVQELGTNTCPRGALGDILDRWIGRSRAA